MEHELKCATARHFSIATRYKMSNPRQTTRVGKSFPNLVVVRWSSAICVEGLRSPRQAALAEILSDPNHQRSNCQLAICYLLSAIRGLVRGLGSLAFSPQPLAFPISTTVLGLRNVRVVLFSHLE